MHWRFAPIGWWNWPQITLCYHVSINFILILSWVCLSILIFHQFFLDWKSTLEQLWVKTLSIHLGTTTTSSTTPATSTTTASTTTTTVTPSTTVTTTTATTSRSKVSTNHDSSTFEVIVGISKSQEKIDWWRHDKVMTSQECHEIVICLFSLFFYQVFFKSHCGTS